ncbi:MAG: hypothetical protein QOD04_770 [Pseudonocardiales bacterium]|nr:hypothetical protein [Pseudonocardiales bacterium]
MPPWAGAWAASVVAGADVGAMAAALLADPTLVTERTLIAGAAVRLDHAGIARVLTEVTGRPVRYQDWLPSSGATSSSRAPRPRETPTRGAPRTWLPSR